MAVPTTGRNRVIAQIEKEKKWNTNSNNTNTNSSYEDALKNRKRSDGKRGRKPKDYVEKVKLDESEIAEAIILNESINQPKKEKDPYSDLD
jgi:hypothetical protein